MSATEIQSVMNLSSSSSSPVSSSPLIKHNDIKNSQQQEPFTHQESITKTKGLSDKINYNENQTTEQQADSVSPTNENLRPKKLSRATSRIATDIQKNQYDDEEHITEREEGFNNC